MKRMRFTFGLVVMLGISSQSNAQYDSATYSQRGGVSTTLAQILLDALDEAGRASGASAACYNRLSTLQNFPVPVSVDKTGRMTNPVYVKPFLQLEYERLICATSLASIFVANAEWIISAKSKDAMVTRFANAIARDLKHQNRVAMESVLPHPLEGLRPGDESKLVGINPSLVARKRVEWDVYIKPNIEIVVQGAPPQIHGPACDVKTTLSGVNYGMYDQFIKNSTQAVGGLGILTSITEGCDPIPQVNVGGVVYLDLRNNIIGGHKFDFSQSFSREYEVTVDE